MLSLDVRRGERVRAREEGAVQGDREERGHDARRRTASRAGRASRSGRRAAAPARAADGVRRPCWSVMRRKRAPVRLAVRAGRSDRRVARPVDSIGTAAERSLKDPTRRDLGRRDLPAGSLPPTSSWTARAVSGEPALAERRTRRLCENRRVRRRPSTRSTPARCRSSVPSSVSPSSAPSSGARLTNALAGERPGDRRRLPDLPDHPRPAVARLARPGRGDPGPVARPVRRPRRRPARPPLDRPRHERRRDPLRGASSRRCRRPGRSASSASWPSSS